ncbi:MAG: DUF4157 domain-containing protein [Chloroflexi bacterium]|nr:DUF4157 domain-containing protein [Chloroflexota bacterium]
MDYSLLQVIAGMTGLKAADLARDRIKKLTLAVRAADLIIGSKPVDEKTRREMEAVTGYDLSCARINVTREAAGLARGLDARAFTVGRHVFAPEEKIDTAFSEGRGLLAHELTHVSADAAKGIEQQGAISASGCGQKMHLPLVQLSRAAQGGASERKLEAEADATGSAAREAERKRPQQVGIDKNMLADTVYRLIQRDLLVHRDRRR